MAKDKDKNKTVCIMSTKGGIGKSVFTLNLAGIYASIKKKVLIVDLDLTSGSIAMALNKPYEKSIYDVIEDLRNNIYEKLDNYTLKYNEYIDCLPCPKDPRQSSLVDPKYIEFLLNRAQYEYDIVLIDTNHILTDINLFALDYSDYILYVMNNDLMNFKGMKSIVSIMNDMGKKNYKATTNEDKRVYPIKVRLIKPNPANQDKVVYNNIECFSNSYPYKTNYNTLEYSENLDVFNIYMLFTS